MPHYHSMLSSILARAKSAATAEERGRLFVLAETCSRAARQEATKSGAHYQERLVEMLARAKCARTEEERAQLFRTAEEWSERARLRDCKDGPR
jgi:hypothetical protein